MLHMTNAEVAYAPYEGGVRPWRHRRRREGSSEGIRHAIFLPRVPCGACPLSSGVCVCVCVVIRKILHALLSLRVGVDRLRRFRAVRSLLVQQSTPKIIFRHRRAEYWFWGSGAVRDHYSVPIDSSYKHEFQRDWRGRLGI
jgi:hypothetical protein